MPQRNSSRRLVIRLVLFTFAGWLLWALGRQSAQAGEPETVTTSVPEGSEPTRAREKAKAGGFSKRRLATTLAFTTLFFAGAAFSAGAGDLVVGALEGSSSCAAEATAEGEPAEPCEEAPPAEEPPADESVPAEVDPSNEASEPAPEPAPSGDESAEEPADDESGEPADDGEEPGQDGETAGDGDSESGGSDSSDGSGDPSSDPGPSDDEDDEWEDEPLDDEPDAGPGSPAHAGDPSDDDGQSHTAGLTDAAHAHEELDFDGGGYGVVWLHRTLPDPTPPAARLAPGFARALLQTSRINHVDWALLLGVLRASGHKDSWPASERSLRQLASRLYGLKANTDEWRAALALGGRTSFADRAVALTRYNRAVGLRALVRGLLAEKAALEARVLGDPRLSIYAAGRADVASGRINVRVLVLLLYLAEAHGQVTVSSLNSGHRLYSRPGVISAHKYGLAVDIAALGGSSILGNQDPGGLTEHAVRNILLLPVEVKPNQIISLLGLGGPSFPLADHYDHIHVGY
jgi:hypothetical protein